MILPNLVSGGKRQYHDRMSLTITVDKPFPQKQSSTVILSGTCLLIRGDTITGSILKLLRGDLREDN